MSTRAHLSACAIVVLVCCTATSVVAQGTFDKRTFFTFSGPFEVPGVTLPAGKYLFRLPAWDTGHRVVQVSSADAKKVYGVFFSIPAERATPAPEPEVRFMETAAGVPPAVKTWWHPGDRTGREFIYPREQAKRLAKVGNQSVLTTRTRTSRAEQTNTRDLTRVSSSGADKGVTDEKTSEGATPTGPASQGQLTGATPDRVRASNTPRRELPRTATLTPVAGLTGAVALLGACALWGWRRRAF